MLAKKIKYQFVFGVNSGSLPKDIIKKYGKPTAKAMVESAERHIEILERLNFKDICLSLKASDLGLTIESYEEAARRFIYPLHLGITHAGTEFSGTVSSSIGLRNSFKRRYRRYN